MTSSLSQYVVTRAHAGFWVQRVTIGPFGIVATKFRQYRSSLAEVRTVVPAGFVRLPRAPQDRPEVVEVWT